MSDSYFRIFKHPIDHNKWEKQIEFASIMEDIEDKIRPSYVAALDFLQKEFGKGFLKNSNINHPVKQIISNKAEWQIQELILFANTLHTLKESSPNYTKLKSKLIPLAACKDEGMPFMEIAESYLKEKFMIDFPEEVKSNKSPDIQIINPENKDTFFIEVSMVKESDGRKSTSDNYYFLAHQFHFTPPIYSYTGRQKIEISREDYSEIAIIISDKKKQVDIQRQVISYSDKRLEFWIAPSDKIEQLDKICEEKRTRRNDISGLPLNFDETDRLISNKIKRKARQIPKDRNGIIYFPVNPFYFMTTDLTYYMSRFKASLADFNDIIGIVLYTETLNPKGDLFTADGKHFFCRKMFGGILSRDSIFIDNPNCNLTIQETTLHKIYRTFL